MFYLKSLKHNKQFTKNYTTSNIQVSNTFAKTENQILFAEQ